MDDTLACADSIAIVGIGCRFPGDAHGPQALWANLMAGLDAITDVPADRWAVSRHYHSRKGSPSKSATRWGGYVNDIDRFDAEFFGISPREASLMDPQQRMLLEVCWEAFEDAGFVPSRLVGQAVGVYVGGFTLDYMLMQLGGADYRSVEPHTATGSMMTLLANRLSYVFGLNGPSLSVDTACSSSLVAVHLACRSLLQGESCIALAGGVNALLSPSYTVAESRAGMLSPTGRSRAFDARADGYVRGEGAGLVVLKRLDRALADGDHVYAVIRASAVNQDGHSDGLTVPSGDAQKALMTQALAQAGVQPAQLVYVEAHGTGTPVGDPIEANAIGTVVAQGRTEDQPCLIGSVKTNFGHTEAAAGVAGLIKTALVLENRCVPAHLHLERTNPRIDLAALRLAVPQQAQALPAEGELLAAVNSFGFGGTNAHAILASAPARGETDGSDGAAATPAYWALPVSGRSDEACRASAQRLADRLAPHAQLVSQAALLRDVCHTAATRREHHDHRACVLGDSVSALIDALQAHAAGQAHPRVLTAEADAAASPPLTFVYAGMGPQWWGMGRQLHAAEPVFREAFDRCAALFDERAGWSLRAALGEDEASSRVADTEVAQPANFALQVALTELLRSWGVHPQAIVGHSAGEPAAAYAAGVLSLEEATRVIFHRSRLQQRTTGMGRLLAVGLTEAQTREHLDAIGDASLSIAAINGPTAITVAGSDAAIEALRLRLESQGAFARALRVKVPYHSVYMEPLREEMLAALADLALSPERVPLYSTVTGTRLAGEQMDAEYWYRNVRQPVLFLDAMQALLADGHGSFLELSPHPVLGGAIQEVATQQGLTATVTSCLRRDGDEALSARSVLASLHVHGHAIDWQGAQGQGGWMRLPTYPWGGGRHWHETPASRRSRVSPPEHPLLATRLDAPLPSWEVDLDSAQLGFLDDHRIQGAVVFPGAGYIEMAAHAARSLYGDLQAVEFADVAFMKALYLSPDHPVTLRLVLDPDSHAFQIASTAYGQDRAAWQIHCTGRVRLSQPTARAPADLDVLRALCPQEIPRAHCYRHFRSLGLEYGTTFQGIAQLWQGTGRAIARLEVPAELMGQLGDFNIHPAVLDVCFQTLAAALPIQREGSSVYMPVAVHEGRVHGPLPDRIWVHARIAHVDAQGMSGDIELLDAQGRCVLEIRDCRARALGDDAGGWVSTPQALYEPVWVARDAQTVEPGIRAGLWLLNGGSDELAQATMSALRRAGCTAWRVNPAAGAERDPLLPQGIEASFDATRVEAWTQLLELASEGTQEVRGVIHLGMTLAQPPAADATRLPDQITQVTQEGNAIVVAVTKALAALDGGRVTTRRPRLWLATRATQAVAGHPVADPLNAAAWGLARVLGHGEHIDIWGGIIDLPAHPDPRDGALIAAECLAESGEDQIAWRDHQRHILRLRTCAPEASLPSAPALRANATYLITGGLGALGLVVARWLVQRGARHLLLVGREGLPPREQWTDPDHAPTVRQRIDAVRDIEACGASVSVQGLDIADAAALQRLVERHERCGLPPVRGVMHAAGVAHPQLIAQMSTDDLHAALPAKVLGAWNLHLAFQDRPLDFFVLFSSIASLVISMGQASYAAANASLDALAHFRRGQGLPATSINWGPWGDVGMATQLDLLKYFHGRGFFPMSSAQGCEALGRLLSGRVAQAAVLGARWKTVADTSPLGIPAPMLEDLLRDEAAAQALEVSNAPDASGDFGLRYRRCSDPGERKDLVRRELRDQVTRVLRIDAAALGDTDTLNSHGMDSMMAIELKNRIERAMSVRMAIVDLLKGASVESIVAHVTPELEAAALNADDALLDIVDALNDLSEAEIEALLADERTTEEQQ